MILSLDDDSYVGHKPCPKCGSKDNVYRYPDGHEFCFGRCGYVKLAPLTQSSICAILQQKDLTERPERDKGMGTIPDYAEDATDRLSDPGLTWIKKYGIQDVEIAENNILWSQSQEQLIFPILDAESNTIAWQARNFKPNTRKYVTFGRMNDLLHILGLTKHEKSDIILVEDIVSAIKVSRHFRCMPLFGSGLSREKLARLRRYTDSLRFWLDRDMFSTSMKLSKIAAQMGFKTAIIHTENDPKSYFNQEIINLGTT